LVTTKPFYPLRCLTQRDIQDAEGAENFLKMTEIQGFAIPDSQSFRSNFGFQV
jgi:hypothetical protein